MTNAVKWGIVGLGGIVQNTVAPEIVARSNMDLVAVASRDKTKALKLARQWGATQATDSYEELLANPDVEAIFIATPNALHEDQVIAAAKAGKHVLCEKPLAITAEGALCAIRSCVESGVQLGVNFHLRQLAWYPKCASLIASGAIGEIAVVQVENSTGHRALEDWRLHKDLAGMGTVHNQGVHVYDIVRKILNLEAVSVFALFDNEKRYEVETRSLALVEYTGGVQAYFNVNSSSHYPRNTFSITGTKGRLDGYDLTRSKSDGVLKITDENGTSEETYIQLPGVAHGDHIEEFSTAIRNGRAPAAAGVDGLYSALLCDAMAQSVAQKCQIEIDYGDLPADLQPPPRT